jgi:hypothetical protein
MRSCTKNKEPFLEVSCERGHCEKGEKKRFREIERGKRTGERKKATGKEIAKWT